jgi:biopolymer transport protein ExbD
MRERPDEIIVAIASDGRTMINRRAVQGRSVELLAAELAAAAQGRSEALLIISADALTTHQAVINVLDAARRAGLTRLSFAAQGGGAPPAR